MSIWSSRPHKTIALLGAGASKGSDHALPTMQGFFGTTVPAPLQRFLEWFYPHTSPADYNLEEVLSYIYIFQSRVPAWTGAAALSVIGSRTIDYELLLDYVAGRLEVQNTPCKRHTLLVQRL